jgi:hypothetical protein
MKTVEFFLGIIAFIALSACTSESPKQNAVENKPAANKIQEPFRFHKAIEVKPGLTFDIVSWGRGSELVGGYLILLSDSTHSKYRSVSNELEGRLVDAWNMDMDSDGNPEIFIQARGDEDENSFLNMYVYEFNDSGSSQKLRFPDLSSSTKKNYHGRDSLYIKEGSLYREFPLFEQGDTSSTKPIGKKVIEYGLRSNNFTVDEVKEGEDD